MNQLRGVTISKLARLVLKEEPELPQTHLGRYQLVRELARGGMGVVYLALDPQLDRPVAIKVIRACNIPDEMGVRFGREAKAAARLSHPGVVRIHEVGMDEQFGPHPVPYIVMDYVEGQPLSQMRGEMSFERGLEALAEVAEAVGQAHHEGVIHRDLKPSNILIGGTGRAVVIDFGLARLEDATQLTRSDQILGTPSYMAPEQLSGVGPIDSRTDVWSLGVMLYELLTGQLPFTGKSFAALQLAISDRDLIPPRERREGVPTQLDQICCKALEKDPDLRYGHAALLAEDLRRHLAGLPLQNNSSSVWEVLRYRLRYRRYLLLPILFVVLCATAFWVGRNHLGNRARVARLETLRREALAAQAAGDWARALAAASRAFEFEKDSELSGIARFCQNKIAEERRESVRIQREQARRKKVRERLHRFRQTIYQARAQFYIPETDVRRWLSQLDPILDSLRQLARQPGLAEDAQVPLLIGQIWYLHRDLSRAESALRRAAQLDPDDGEINYYLGRVYMEHSLLTLVQGSRGRRAFSAARQLSRKAWRQLQRMITSWHGSRPIDRHLGALTLTYMQRKYDLARKLCQVGITKFSGQLGSETYWRLLAYLSPLDKRLALFDKALQICPHDMLTHLGRGITRRQLGQLRGAAADFNQVLRLVPEQWNALLLRGVVREQLGDVSGALTDLDQVLQLSPKNLQVLILRGQMRTRLGRLKDALEDFDSALAIDSSSAPAYEGRSRAHWAGGDRRRALADCNRSLAVHPEDARMLTCRGYLLWLGGDPRGAIRDYTRAIVIAPKFALAYNNRGIARTAIGNNLGARKDYTRTIALDPKFANAYNNRGHVRQLLGDLAGAIKDYDQAIKLDPRLSTVYHNRGVARQANGDLPGAIRDFTQAITLFPKYTLSYNSRGTARRAAGDLRGAVEDYRLALEQDPRYWEAGLNLGVALGDLKQYSEGLDALRTALRHAPAAQKPRIHTLIEKLSR